VGNGRVQVAQLAVLQAVNPAVRRNSDRFPSDFMFELADNEVAAMVSQNVIPGLGKLGGARPMAFTEQGVAMLSSVLRSRRAVQVNIAIMRVFVRLRDTLALHKELAHKLAELERKIEGHDTNIRTLFDAIRELAAPPATPRREIGYHVKEDGLSYRTCTWQGKHRRTFVNRHGA
jgi:hypothetical protein